MVLKTKIGSKKEIGQEKKFDEFLAVTSSSRSDDVNLSAC